MLPITPSARSATLGTHYHQPTLHVKYDVETGNCSLGLKSAMTATPTAETDATLPVRLKLDFRAIPSTSTQHALTLTASTPVPLPSPRSGLGRSKEQTPLNLNSNCSRPSTNGPLSTSPQYSRSITSTPPRNFPLGLVQP